MMSGQNKIILVTGGAGLVGSAIQSVVSKDERSDEKWIFVNSKDADLWYVILIKFLFISQLNLNLFSINFVCLQR